MIPINLLDMQFKKQYNKGKIDYILTETLKSNVML